MSAVLVTSDLVVSSRISGAAADCGATVEVFLDADRLWESPATVEAMSLLILDLSTPGLDVQASVARLRRERADRTAVIAFGPHVHGAKLEAAREAGCDETFTRGQFHSQIASILGRYLQR